MGHISIDYETFYSNKLKYTLKSQIAEQYCRHELFDPYTIAVTDGGSSWAGSIKDFNWGCLDNQVVVAHNAYFEKAVTTEIQRRQWCPPDVLARIKELHCTANMTAYLCNRRALDAAVEHLYKTKVDKSARSDANGKHWPQDFSAEQQKTALEYAKGDVFWCHKLWKDFSPQWPEHERRLSRMTIDQGLRGVQIDTELLDNYIVWTHEMKLNTEKVLPWIAGAEDEEWEEFNAKPTSTKCIAEQCRRVGIPCPPVKSDDEEAFVEWEETYGKDHPWISALSAWRSINKLYKTFLTVKERLRSDGTLPFGLKYFGAHTGRWSGDSRVNMQNMRQKPILCNERGLLELDDRRVDLALLYKSENSKWPEWVRYAIDFRHLIIPRPGKKMIISDLSQIEPRVLAWLAGDTALLDLLRGGMSVYEAHARATMDWKGGVLKTEDPGKYKLAKARILGLGFQCGWEKFIKMAYTLSGIDITVDDPEWVEEQNLFTGEVTKVSGYGTNSKRIVADYRGQNAKIVNLWGTLRDAFQGSVGGDCILTLPSGRKMRYEQVRGETRIEPDPKTGKPRRVSVYTANVDGRRKPFYGGKLTENITQASARDVFSEHLLALEDAGFTNLFSCHDEAILEVDRDVTATDVEHVMSKCPDWLEGCPIGAEAHEVSCYQK